VSDDDRFTRLCVDHHDHILGYALRRTNSAEDAADIVADVFLAAWRRIGDVPVGEGALPWLYGTARRVLANHYRGERRQRALAARLASALPPLTEQVTDHVDDGGLASMAAAFAALGDDDREILALVGWEGLDRDAIAAVMNCTRATVRVRLHRARRRFDSALREHGVNPQRSKPSGHTEGRRSEGRPSTKEAL
jgi:RNA polymerase sigma factor (sigma-70 family)